MESDAQFLEFLVKAIVDHPDKVVVNRKVDEMGVLLSLKVDPQDMGQVVGRQGATAKAIRSLLRIVGMKNNARVNLKIEEPDGGTRSTPQDRRPSPPAEEETPEQSAVDKAVEDLNL
jgi:hypothetical protein